jgi:hypothetical protein
MENISSYLISFNIYYDCYCFYIYINNFSKTEQEIIKKMKKNRTKHVHFYLFKDHYIKSI